MKYRGFGILECQGLCENTTLSELGLNSDMWLPFAFDLGKIRGVKLAVSPDDDDSTQHGRAQVFFDGSDDYVVLDISFEDMMLVWMAFRKGELQVDKEYSDFATAFAKFLTEGRDEKVGSN